MKSGKYYQDRMVPLALGLLALLAFGLFIPWLGFYWDDWPVLMMYKFFGTSAYASFYAYDRPFSFWTYVVTMPVLGLHPVAWQVFTLLLRWLTTLFVWLSLRLLWPNLRTQVAWIAILFLVYPVFSLQFISVAFSQHWICFLLYAVSFWAMLKSWKADRFWFFYLILSFLTAVLHLWTMEYFLGMEIFRLLIIWLFLSPGAGTSLQNRVSRFFKWAWAYLLIIGAFIWWRLFILKLPQSDPNAIRFLTDLRTQPITGIINLTQLIIRDLIYMLIRVWSDILVPSRFIINSKFFLFAVFVAILSGVGIVTFLSKLSVQSDDPHGVAPTFPVQFIILGFIAIILGALPGWVTYREVLTVPYGSRIALPSQLGLSMFVVGLIDWLLAQRTRKLLVYGSLISLSVFSHLYTADYYREAWSVQRQFYWQFYWRVPGLLPQTAILSDSEVVPSAGTYSTAAAMNMIYGQRPVEIGTLPYWFFNMGHQFGGLYDNFISGKNIYAKFRNWGYLGDSENSLLVDYDGTSCVKVVIPDKVENPLSSEVLQNAVRNSNADRILVHDISANDSPAIVFGAEPAHTWCFYYEKAELARQFQDWKQIISLGEQAKKLGLQPQQVTEWLPFVDAYVNDGKTEAAISLTRDAYTHDPRDLPEFCSYWQTLINGESPKFSDTDLVNIHNRLQCEFK